MNNILIDYKNDISTENICFTPQFEFVNITNWIETARWSSLLHATLRKATRMEEYESARLPRE